ncbi:MAG: YbaK/EbsC family protein [Oscillospiraceae bacterium]|nr:YbaK/EbsC family protein [Oscillospiraceae bacterium]
MYKNYNDIKNILSTSINELNTNVQKLDRDVISCKEAVRAKNIPLKNELKSLVIRTEKGFVLLHIRGDYTVDLRSVKRKLDVKDACLASFEDLILLNVRCGTVNPFRDSLQKLPQLISDEIFRVDFLSTNYNGHLNEYVFFTPEVLLESLKRSPKLFRGYFIKEKEREMNNE